MTHHQNDTHLPLLRTFLMLVYPLFHLPFRLFFFFHLLLCLNPVYPSFSLAFRFLLFLPLPPVSRSSFVEERPAVASAVLFVISPLSPLPSSQRDGVVERSHPILLL